MEDNIFISHSVRNNHDSWTNNFIENFKNYYEEFIGVKPNLFYSSVSIQIGSDWESKILENLKKCKILVALISPTYIKSEWCKREWMYFLDKENDLRQLSVKIDLIVPILIVNLKSARLTGEDEEFLSIIKRKQWLMADKDKFINSESSSYFEQVTNQCSLKVFKLTQAIKTTNKHRNSSSELNRKLKKLDLDISNPISGHIFGSLLDKSNEYKEVNSAILDSWTNIPERSKKVYPFEISETHLAFAKACEVFIENFSINADNKSKLFRFITTNTSLDRVGLNDWFDDSYIRKTMLNTGRILNKRKSKYEVWRIFIIKSINDFFKYSYRTKLVFDENYDIGIRTGVILEKNIDKSFSIDYCDFFCIPNEIVSLSISPYYFISIFQKINNYDKPVLEHYTGFSEFLVEAVLNKNIEYAFEWTSGTEEELKKQLKRIDNA